MPCLEFIGSDQVSMPCLSAVHWIGDQVSIPCLTGVHWIGDQVNIVMC